MWGKARYIWWRSQWVQVRLIQAWARGDNLGGRIIVARTSDNVLFAVGMRLASVVLCVGDRAGAPDRLIMAMSTDDGQTFEDVDIDDVPPVVRAIGRFVVAAGSRDTATAHAVWSSMPHSDRVLMILNLTNQAGHHLHHAHGLIVTGAPDA
jgi:hypothetical protein